LLRRAALRWSLHFRRLVPCKAWEKARAEIGHTFLFISFSFFFPFLEEKFPHLVKRYKERFERTERIADMSCFKHALPTTIEAQIGAAVTDLVRRNSSKPRTEKTLSSTLHALFKKEASEEQLSNLIHHLRERGIVRVEGGKVSYRLPVSPA